MSANGSCMLRVVLSPWKTYDVALTWSFKDRVAAAALQAHFLPCGGRATHRTSPNMSPSVFSHPTGSAAAINPEHTTALHAGRSAVS